MKPDKGKDRWRHTYLRLHPKAALKDLEEPCVYHAGRDELYEIDRRAMDFLSQCNGTKTGKDLTDKGEFVRYCLKEGILEALDAPDPVDVVVGQGADPSLRYLELHLLHKCNLKCRHCYLGALNPAELPLADAVNIARQFSAGGGLRLLISGGEPMLYKDLKSFLVQTGGLNIRRVLFTNGTLINDKNIGWMDVDEIQFSLDGWEQGHELLRGEGTFASMMAGIQSARTVGISISFSTMVHRGNLDEFDRMQAFIRETGAVEWGIDMMAVTGSLEKSPDLAVPWETAAPFLEYAYGGGYHGSSDGYACGRHLMAVMPDGQAVKCGFYRGQPLGNAAKSLNDCWLKIPHIPLDHLECRDCPVLNECRGGCRFRAPHMLAPDPAMCCVYGIQKTGNP
ncbi:MAG: radical SAM protein [Desulfosalsimonadaceae bacterium]